MKSKCTVCERKITEGTLNSTKQFPSLSDKQRVRPINNRTFNLNAINQRAVDIGRIDFKRNMTECQIPPCCVLNFVTL